MKEDKAYYYQYEDIQSILRGFRRKDSIVNLVSVFNEANSGWLTTSEEDLGAELLAVLQHEMSAGAFVRWECHGANHLIVTSYNCILINIYGVRVLLDSWLFFEGEILLRNIRWMDDDHLLLLEFFYPVHEEFERCVCHYSNNSNEFVIVSRIERDPDRKITVAEHKGKHTFKLPPMATGYWVDDPDGSLVRTDPIFDCSGESHSETDINDTAGWEDDDW